MRHPGIAVRSMVSASKSCWIEGLDAEGVSVGVGCGIVSRSSPLETGGFLLLVRLSSGGGPRKSPHPLRPRASRRSLNTFLRELLIVRITLRQYRLVSMIPG
jgi:hypothetical protein